MDEWFEGVQGCEMRTDCFGAVAPVESPNASNLRWLSMPSRRNFLRIAGTSLSALLGAGSACGTITGSRVLAAESARAWPHEYAAGRFQIHSDFEIDPKGTLLSELDQLSTDVSKLLSVNTTNSPLHVVLFASPEEYRRYITHYYPTVPDRRALFIQDRGVGMLFAQRHADLATDLRHEATHGLLNDCAKPLSLWLDEGLAEYFEVPCDSRLHGHGHLPPTCHSIDEGALPDLERLESLKETGAMGSEDYREAWSVVHFIMHRHPETRAMLVDYLAAARSGTPAEPFSRALPRRIPHWQTAFGDHFQKLNLAGK